MKPIDLTPFSEKLDALSEAFDRKSLTPRAIEVWFATLKEFNSELIFGLLASWPKNHGKFPVPAEIWTIANNIGVADRERVATQLRTEARQPVHFARTEEGARIAAELIGSMRRSRITPIEHWRRVLGEAPEHSIGRRYAVEALAIMERKRGSAPARAREPREPGEDDEDLNTMSLNLGSTIAVSTEPGD